MQKKYIGLLLAAVVFLLSFSLIYSIYQKNPASIPIPSYPIPTIASSFCGGIGGIACPDGFICQLDGTYPDAGGTCVKSSGNYICPPSGWVDCMPGPDRNNEAQCSKEAMSWYQTNCPDFQGAAL